MELSAAFSKTKAFAGLDGGCGIGGGMLETGRGR